MTANEVSDFITALRALEQRLDTLTIMTGRMPQPSDYHSRAELATYVRELNMTASAWHTQSDRLMQLLSDHPGLVASVPPVVVAPVEPALASLFDMRYKRMGLQVSWEHQEPLAYMHAGMVSELSRRGFREVYRRVLQQFANEHGPDLIVACQRAPAFIPLTTDRDTYHHATVEHHGHIFNVQLSAERIRTCINALYAVFQLPQNQFAVWV